MYYLTKKQGKWDKQSQEILAACKNGSWALGKKEDIRSLDQNAGLWRWDNFLANEVGYTAKEMHYLMCGEIFGWDEHEIQGKQFRIPKRTTRNLNKGEWQDYIKDYRIRARELFNVEMPNFGWDDF